MRKLWNALTILLFLLIPVRGVGVQDSSFVANAPVLVLTVGFLLCPLYTAFYGFVTGKSIVYTFLMPKSVISSVYEGAKLYAFGQMYQLLLLLLYVSAIVVIVVLLIKRKKRAVLLVRDVVFCAFFPYLLAFATYGEVGYIVHALLILYALVIAVHLACRVALMKKIRK